MSKYKTSDEEKIEDVIKHLDGDLEPIPNYGDHYTLEEFISMCLDGVFGNWDGSGYYATKTGMSRVEANPSEIVSDIIDKSWTHVMWFNK